MKPDTLKKLIAEGETEHVEFKSSVPTHDALAREVCSFLNGKGGRIFLGVSDGGTLKNIPDAPAVAQKIGHHLAAALTPKALWTVEPLLVDDKQLLVIEVPEGQDKPYVVEGAIYLRRGTQTVPASREEISSLLRQRTVSSLRWERQMAVGAERGDLDDNIIQDTMRLAIDAGRWQGDSAHTDDFLNDMGLVANGGITHAALLLYGRKPARFLPQARVRLLVLPEGKTGNHYAVDKLFEGCMVRLASDIPAKLEAQLGGVLSTFSASTWQRSDRQQYPKTAIREGVMNALVHRDYQASGSITIQIRPDSFQISNPGGLPDGLTPASLKKDHPSVPRNPDIAHICFLHGLIEKIGRGTQRIMEDFRANKLKAPKWTTSALETTLTFASAVAIDSKPEELNDRQKELFRVLQSNAPLKVADLAIALTQSNVSDRTLRSDLTLLIHQGLAIRHGKGPKTTYTVAREELKA